MPSLGHVAPPTPGGDSASHLVAQKFGFGWAVHPPHGKTKGALYMTDEYKAFFTDLFSKGETNKGEKKPAPLMLEALRKKVTDEGGAQGPHPRRIYHLPDISEISAVISQISQTKKKAKKGALGPPTSASSCT